MIGIIKKHLNNGLQELAKEYGTTPDNIQIVICFKGTAQDSEINYWAYVDFEPKKQISFTKAIGKEGKLSFLAAGQEQLAENFLKNKMQVYVVVDNIKIENLFFIIHLSDGEIMAMVMDKDKCIETLSINDLLA